MSYSLIASWWGARKHIANWWLWIIVDLVYIGEYIYKDLWITAVLYAGLVGLAILGLREWRRAAASDQNRGLNYIFERSPSYSAATHRPPCAARARKLRRRSSDVRP